MDELQGQVIVEDNAGARAGQSTTRLIGGQRRIGHKMSRGHVEGQGTRHRAGMTRAGPELSPEQHQNGANNATDQNGVMPQTGWRAQQATQGAEWEI